MKGYNGPSILCAVLFSAILLSPAFADMEKVDEAELARTNASVTGTSIKKRINCVEKDGICSETKQDSVTYDKATAASSPVVKGTTTEKIILDLNISGQKTFQFYFGGSTSNTTGGITSVKPF